GSVARLRLRCRVSEPARRSVPCRATRTEPGRYGRRSRHRGSVGGRVPPGGEVLELALDVGEECRGPDAEQRGAEPAVAQLFLHEDQPVERGTRRTNPARRLEAHGPTGFLVV